MNRLLRTVTSAAVAAALAGCVYNHRQPEEIQQELQKSIQTNAMEIPSDVAAELGMGKTAVSEKNYVSSKRLRIQAQNAEAQEFFPSLVAGSGYGVVVHPEVSGLISLDLKDVTLQEVMNAISSIYGYDIELKDKIFYIYPSGVRTEVFSVDYLLVKRSGKSSLNITTGGVTQEDSSSDSGSGSGDSGSSSSDSDSDSGDGFDGDSGTSVSTATSHEFWTSLQTALTAFIGKSSSGGAEKSVLVQPEAGIVVVRATPAELKTIRSFLDQATKRVTRQVLLEAKIMEVVLSEDFQYGINWKSLFGPNEHGSGAFQAFNPLVSDVNASIGGVTSFVFGDSNLSVIVDMLKTQGDVSILSSPRVAASNNQKAVIKVGEDEYFVTEVSSSTTSSAATTTTAPDVTFTPFFSGVALDVTPQIDDDGTVTMQVHPAVIDVKEQTKSLTIYDQKMSVPMAKSTIREADTVVRAKSGDVIVIGGLMTEIIEQEKSGVPVLGDIPVIGNLFSNHSDRKRKAELVILLRPIVVDSSQVWKDEMRRSNELLEKWYPDEPKSFTEGLLK